MVYDVPDMDMLGLVHKVFAPDDDYKNNMEDANLVAPKFSNPMLSQLILGSEERWSSFCKKNLSELWMQPQLQAHHLLLLILKS